MITIKFLRRREGIKQMLEIVEHERVDLKLIPGIYVYIL